MAISILIQEMLQTLFESNTDDCSCFNNPIHSHKCTIMATQSTLSSVKFVASKPNVTVMLETNCQDWGRLICAS